MRLISKVRSFRRINTCDPDRNLFPLSAAIPSVTPSATHSPLLQIHGLLRHPPQPTPPRQPSPGCMVQMEIIPIPHPRHLPKNRPFPKCARPNIAGSRYTLQIQSVDPYCKEYSSGEDYGGNYGLRAGVVFPVGCVEGVGPVYGFFGGWVRGLPGPSHRRDRVERKEESKRRERRR